MNNPAAILPDETTINSLARAEHHLTQTLSRSVAALVRGGAISGSDIEALAAITAGYDLLTATGRADRRSAAWRYMQHHELREPHDQGSNKTNIINMLEHMPATLEMNHVERDFLEWWQRLQTYGHQVCMPVVLDIAVQGLSLSACAEKRHCDKRTARSRLLLGLRHYQAARSGGGSNQIIPPGARADGDMVIDAGTSPSIEDSDALDPRSALRLAVRIAGGPTALAKRIGTNQQNSSYWLKKGESSVRYARAIEHETGVPAARLRPDHEHRGFRHRVAQVDDLRLGTRRRHAPGDVRDVVLDEHVITHTGVSIVDDRREAHSLNAVVWLEMTKIHERHA